VHRRQFLQGAAIAALAAPLLRARGEVPAATQRALEESPLVYLTPLKSNGEESRCHSEIWFVAHAGAIYLVTASDAWRARAVKAGLTRARIWVGDFGVWTKAGDRFRTAPMFEATASIVTDPAVHAAVLEPMGEKYRSGWITWGPRFRNGLQSGTRVMLQYVPVA
jgi:hypothetical protein